VNRAAQQLNSGSLDDKGSLEEAAEWALDDNSGWLRLRTSDVRDTISSGPEGEVVPEGEAVAVEVTNLLGQHPVCMRVAEVPGPALTAHWPGGGSSAGSWGR
jgi:hypothetical protein